jgi:UDP-glucuronate 4-epimerase
MKLLVTGGAGFIGSHLLEKLAMVPHEVTIIDNIDAYYDQQLKLDHLQALQAAGVQYKFIQGDLRDSAFCEEVFRAASFDAVIHLAALPGVPYSLLEPHKYIEMNIQATVNVLRCCGETGVKHVMFASSSSVYGDQANVPLTEAMAVGQVNSPYAASKYGAESFCYAYQSLYGFQLTILRFFTVYGPWGRPDMAIPKFIAKLLRGETIEVYGQGLSRDFTYIDDIINGITLALHHSEGNQVYNLGYGQPVAMDRLIEHFQARFPHMKMTRKPMRQGDVMSTWSDVSKAAKLLGFKPSVGIEEGLDRTLSWAKQYLASLKTP